MIFVNLDKLDLFIYLYDIIFLSLRLFCKLSIFSNEEAVDEPFSDTRFGRDECRLTATFIPGFCMGGTPGRFLFRVSFVVGMNPVNTMLLTEV